MPAPRFGYGHTDSNLLVRIDVTYLRQDFSAVQNVTDWSANARNRQQRFDFLRRRRVLSPPETADLRERLAGESPYQRAAANALAALTGREGAVKIQQD